MKQGTDCIGVTVVYFCHDGKGNVLLAQRSSSARDEQGRWDIGGGAVEFGAGVEETVRKELKEEYCTDVLEYEFLGFRDVHRMYTEEQGSSGAGRPKPSLYAGKPTHWIALDFKVLVDRNKAAIGEPHKFVALDWFTLDKLPSPLHSQLPHFLEKYKDRL